MALALPSRLWLGGVISAQRDLSLITTLVPLVRSCARTLAILVCVDGLASSVTASYTCSGTLCARAAGGGPGWSWSQGCSWAKWSSGTPGGAW